MCRKVGGVLLGTTQTGRSRIPLSQNPLPLLSISKYSIISDGIRIPLLQGTASPNRALEFEQHFKLNLNRGKVAMLLALYQAVTGNPVFTLGLFAETPVASCWH